MAAAVQHSLQATGLRSRRSAGYCRSSNPCAATALTVPATAGAAAARQHCQQVHSIRLLNKNRSNRSSHRLVGRQQQQHICQASLRPLEVSSSIAAARATESSRPDALFQDPYAAALCSQQPSSNSSSSGSAGASSNLPSAQQVAMDVIATQYIDESLLNAMDATSINSIQAGDYRQVVLLGDGFDTRPFRLMWPPGTLLFSVAPAEVHEQAEARLAAAQPPAHVMRGCLLRRVNMNIRPAVAAAAEAARAAAGTAGRENLTDSSSSSSVGGSGGNGVGGDSIEQQQQQQQQQQGSPSATVFREQLSRAGFRADRLSVWVLQGLHNQGLGPDVLRQLLAEVAGSAAFHSLIVGELPGPLTRQQADNLMAEAGLLGAVYDHETADNAQYKRWQQVWTEMPLADVTGQAAASSSSSSSSSGEQGGVAPRWIVAGQQLRLSLAQMGIYDEWSSEFEEADFGDDYIGNVS